jgi:two-component system OmpR family sensor kinase
VTAGLRGRWAVAFPSARSSQAEDGQANHVERGGRSAHRELISRGERRVGTAGRLALFHAVVLVVALGAVVIALARSFTASYEAAAATNLGSQLREYQQAARARPAGQGIRAFSVQYLETHPLAAGGTVVVSLVGSGLVVTGNAAPLIHDPVVRPWFTRPPLTTQAFATNFQGIPVEVVAAPIRSGRVTVGTYIAASDLSSFASERARVVELSLAEAAVALLVGAASALFLLRRLLRTIGRITRAAEQIGNGALEQRLGYQGTSDEVGELARTFDAMLDHLEAAMQAQRRLLSDVSHQLRTPLTVVRGHLEVLARTGSHDPAEVRETTDLVIDELDHMAHLVERLLMLGRAMEPDLLVVEPFPLRDLLVSIRDSVGVLAPQRLQLGTVPELTLVGDREQLRGAIINLVDNAVHATSAGSVIELGARVDSVSGGVRLFVEDSGPGIPASEREAALRRFARPGARAEGGSGLGLAIAKAVALAHRGSISIDQSPTLGGARVALVLPPESLCAPEV